MQPLLVVERFDIFKELAPGILHVDEMLAEFELERREPALHHRVVETIATAAHAANHAVVLEQVPVVLACIGAALVRVGQQSLFGLASQQRLVLGGDHQVAIVVQGQGPTHDGPRIQIHHRRQVDFPVIHQ